MGATIFLMTSAGKDASDAFNSAVTDARYERGHGGYTGSIAEKHSFSVFEAPKRMSAFKFAKMVEKASFCISNETKIVGVPLKHRGLVERAARVFDDKWGAAVCVPLVGKELQEYKARRGLKGTHKKVFIFCGWASE